MSNPNIHIEEFIKYYFNFKPEPGYAVLLKGKWGSGKTWFIKKTLDSLKKPDVKQLYLSLYGVTSFNEIEDELFRQLHPVLASKTMILATKFAKGFLKATIKVDLDSDGKEDDSVSFQIPELDLSDYRKDYNDLVIVFDDLERVSIDLEKLLGYINYFVEHKGCKVILIANEEEILNYQEGSDCFKYSYRRIKEKLVGKTFEIMPDLDGALNCFLSEIKNATCKSLFDKNFSIIVDVYKKSGYQNLRHLKQALWDFERFQSFICDNASSKKGLLDHLLKIFLILIFEIRSGDFLPIDISGLLKQHYLSKISGKSKDGIETLYHVIKKKYYDFNSTDLLIDESIWIDFFDKGICSRERIQESLERTKYFLSENTTDWERLWHSMELTDEEFTSALDSVKKDFKKRAFLETRCG